MKLKAFFCAALFSVLTASAVPVSAELIIGNGDLSVSTSSSGTTFGAHDGYGVRFQMGSNAATVVSANVLMRNGSAGSVTKNFTARIYGNSTILNNPTPSPLLSATFDVSLGAGVAGWFDVNFGAGINLAASQSYVFAIEETTKDATGADIAWREPASASYSSGIGASGLGSFVRRADADAFYTDFGSAPNYGFQLHSVPEPSSMALMGMGLASVAAAARKRFKKKSVTVVAPVESAV